MQMALIKKNSQKVLLSVVSAFISGEIFTILVYRAIMPKGVSPAFPELHRLN
jgi:hypothetical protein